jgi:hypothetical protein
MAVNKTSLAALDSPAVRSEPREEPSRRASSPASARRGVRRFLFENGLSIALFALFLGSFVGQIGTGLRVHNDELVAHGQGALSLGAYLSSGHFIEATFENWESEFLQMALFVLLTVKLRQKGSSESKKLDEHEEVDDDPAEKKDDPRAPWPVRRGGLWLRIYQHSLTLALASLFVACFVLHGVGGFRAENAQNAAEGLPLVTCGEFFASSQFWFQSFQNWQSEFVSVLAVVLLSVVLRQRGSSQSKPVAAPHAQTGD